ncbi:MAG: 50S ribosomal protein L6 [Nanoarchaeota archaeon]
MKNELKREIVLGEKVSAELKNTHLKIKGPKGEVERNFPDPQVHIQIHDGKIVVSSTKGTKRIKMQLGSIVAHIKNTVKGVKEPHVYKLKICSGHFPMNVAVSGSEIIIKNFFGETVPRKAALPKGVEVKISGNDITITSPNLEAAGLAASTIENLCRITNRDIRIFQDGCYITQKPE